jgi:hypothetical protein
MVSRATIIYGVPAADVYRQVADFNNWKNWHPIFTIDSATINAEAGTIGQSKFVISRGEQTLHLTHRSSDSTSVKFLLQSPGENDIENDILVTTLPGQPSIQVEWRAITKLSWYPWEKFYGIFVDQLTGPGYETALSGLKTFLEDKK